MATVGLFNVALVASTSRFISAISQADRRWNNFARNIQRQSKNMPKAIQAVTPAALSMARAITVATTAAGTALAGLGTFGVKLAAEFEQTQIAFTTLLGDAQRADQFLRELDIFAQRTPFNVDAVRQAARQLLAYGFAADKILPMLTPIGDAVAAMGGSREIMERVIRAIGQIQAKGRVMAEEMLQLTEAGIPAWQYLADAMGVSIREVMDLSRKGAIDATTAINAILRGMNQQFEGAMEAQSRTILGQWERLKESMIIITRGIGQDIVRFGIATALERINNAIGRFSELVSREGFIGALRNAFPPWIVPVIVGIAGAIGGALVPVIVSWLIPALKKLAVSLWAVIRPLTPWMAIGAVVATTAFIIAKYWGQLPALANAVWNAVGAAALYAASLVVRGVGAMISVLAFLLPPLRGAAQMVNSWADSLKASATQALSNAKSALATGNAASKAAQGIQAAADSAHNTAQTAEQAAQAQEDLDKAMNKAAKSAENNLQSFDEVHQIQEKMGSAADVAAGAMQMPDIGMPEIQDVAGGIAGAMGELANVLEQTINKVSGAFERLEKILQPISKHLETIAGVMSVFLLPRFLAFGGRILEVINFSERLRTALSKLRGAFVSLGETIRNTTLARWFTEAVAVVRAKINELARILNFNKIFAFFRENVLVRWITEAFTILRSRFAELWALMLDMIRRIAEAFAILRSRFAEFGALIRDNAMVRFFSEIGRRIAQIGSWAAKIFAPIRLLWSWIVKIFSWVGKLWDLLTKIPFLGSILKVIGHFAGLLGWILLVVDAVRAAIWVFKNWNDIPDILAAKWEAFKSWMIDTWENIKTAISNIVDVILKVVSEKWDGIKTSVSTKLNEIRNAISEKWNNIRTNTIEVWNTILSGLNQKWTEMTTTASMKWANIKNTISTWWENVRGDTIEKWNLITTWLGTKWNEIHSTVLTRWTNIKTTVSHWWENIRLDTAEKWNLITSWLSTKWNEIYLTVSTKWANIKNTIATWWENIQTNTHTIWTNISNWLSTKWGNLNTTAGTKWTEIKNTIGTWWDKIHFNTTETWNSISKWLEDTWRNLRNSAAEWGARIIQAFKDAIGSIRLPIPTISIEWREGPLGINIPDLNIGVNWRSLRELVPWLAEGGIVGAPTLAMIGEGARPEAVVPLPPGVRDLGDLTPDEETLAQAIYQAFVTALRVTQASGPQSNTELVLKLDSREVARELLPAILCEAQRQGLQLTVRPQGV